jgi:hypothetical protein
LEDEGQPSLHYGFDEVHGVTGQVVDMNDPGTHVVEEPGEVATPGRITQRVP